MSRAITSGEENSTSTWADDRSLCAAEFRRLLEKLPAGAYTCDQGGLITYYNERAVSLWGRAPLLNHPDDRYCGSFLLFSTVGETIRHDQCWMARALQDNREYNGREIVIQRPDGNRLTALAFANPIRNDAGAVIGAVNVLVDISERKQLEDRLRAADSAKDEFLAILAHELRNPLAPIANALQIFRAQKIDSTEARWAMDVMARQTGHLTRLIDDLLDVSRITRNNLELRRQRVELAELIRSAVETSRPLIDHNGITLTVTLGPEPIYLLADSTRITQAIANLLNNAAKYTERNGRIWIEVQGRGSHASIIVRDTGIGISPKLLPRVFDLFSRGDMRGYRSQDGLGIGLTLVKRLIELHGGSVEARSQGTGRGSEFEVRLPVEDTLPAAESDQTRAESEASGRALRILVADDNQDSANSLAMLLKIMGHTVRAAYNGQEAIDAAQEFEPDVAFLDIGMPVLNGYDAARTIRAQSQGRRLILVAVTGWGQDSDKQNSREAGFDHHIVKPLNADALVTLLQSI